MTYSRHGSVVPIIAKLALHSELEELAPLEAYQAKHTKKFNIQSEEDPNSDPKGFILGTRLPHRRTKLPKRACERPLL